MPLVRIDFYRVRLPQDHDGTFEDLLRSIEQQPVERRVEEVAGGWIYLLDLAQTQSHLRGTIARVKADEIPPAADRAGTLQDLQLNADQGIAGVTHFMYRPSNGILVLQRNFQGVRAPAYENYVRHTTRVDVELRPILQLEVLRKLRRFRVVRKLAIKLANPQALVHARLGRSVAGLIDVMNEHEALVAELTLGMGPRRGSLNVDMTRTTIERLFRIRERTDDVKKIVAYGREHEEEKTMFLDLLQDRIVETADVPVGANRRLSDQACIRALQDAYQRREEELAELIGD